MNKSKLIQLLHDIQLKYDPAKADCHYLSSISPLDTQDTNDNPIKLALGDILMYTVHSNARS